MKIPKNDQYILFGGSFILANKLQLVADKKVEGLSTKQWFLLRTLQDMPENPAPTITSLAEETDTTRQNVTKMLEALNRQGCVVLKNNPQDQRSRIVEMTERGRQLLDRMAANAKGFFKELFAGVDEKESRAAAGVIVKMIGNLCGMQEKMG